MGDKQEKQPVWTGEENCHDHCQTIYRDPQQ